MKPTLGQTLREPLRFTQAQVEAFAALTGDDNPVHLDAEFAAGTPFGRPIVHGMLAAAVFSKLLGTRMPGNGTLYLQQQLEFRKPMYVEVDYTAQLKVLEVNEAKNRAVVETLILDAEGAAIVRGQAMVKYQD
jgi:acyl dehydratase